MTKEVLVEGRHFFLKADEIYYVTRKLSQVRGVHARAGYRVSDSIFRPQINTGQRLNEGNSGQEGRRATLATLTLLHCRTIAIQNPIDVARTEGPPTLPSMSTSSRRRTSADLDPV